MKKIAIENLIPGMIIASDVYTYNDQLVLPKGLTLTDKSITRLRFYSISQINIEEDSIMPNDTDSTDISEANIANDTSIPVDEDSPTAFSDSVKSSEVFQEFKDSFEHTVREFNRTMTDLIEHNTSLDTKKLLSQTLSIFDTNGGDFNLFNMLHNLRTYDDDTYAHSVNVALICHVFSKWLKLSPEETEIATLAGLLHDIGKMKVPENIIHKPAKLTEAEYSVVKTHPTEGYRILQTLDIDDRIRKAALMHHERCNGSGYPLGIIGNQIDPIAKLVAIVDVYEATTASRIYRGPLSPFEVIELFQSEGIQKYDVLYIMTFLENIVSTYTHYGVILSDGTEGTIIFINKQDLARPIVRAGNQFIDLTTHPTLSISKII